MKSRSFNLFHFFRSTRHCGNFTLDFLFRTSLYAFKSRNENAEKFTPIRKTRAKQRAIFTNQCPDDRSATKQFTRSQNELSPTHSRRHYLLYLYLFHEKSLEPLKKKKSPQTWTQIMKRSVRSHDILTNLS